MRRPQSIADLRKHARAAGWHYGAPLVSSASAAVIVVTVGLALWPALRPAIERYWARVPQYALGDATPVQTLLQPGWVPFAALLGVTALASWLVYGVTTQHWWGKRDRKRLARLGVGAPLFGQRSAEHIVSHGIALAVFGLSSVWLLYATPRLAPHPSATPQSWQLALVAVANTMVWTITTAACVDTLQRYAWHHVQLKVAAQRPPLDDPQANQRHAPLAPTKTHDFHVGAHHQCLFLYGTRSYVELAWQPTTEAAPRLVRSGTGIQPSQLRALLAQAKRTGRRTRCAPNLTQALIEKPHDTQTWQTLAPVWVQTFP